jgi:hypothetical protein
LVSLHPSFLVDGLTDSFRFQIRSVAEIFAKSSREQLKSNVDEQSSRNFVIALKTA